MIGTGLIGTSVALALRENGVRTYLHDRDPAAAATAAARGAGVLGLPSSMVDLAVIAVPPSSIAAVLAECQANGLARCYTDVGSAKTEPLAEAEATGCDLTSYVGGHPMAGGERSGPVAATADLFRDRTWALTPLTCTRADALRSVMDFVGMTGARPLLMTHVDHDRIVARTSHVPHLVASALAASLAGADASVLRLCGAGVKDATRIAAGDVALWTDILRANATEVSKILSEIATDLASVAHSLQSDPGEVAGLLRRGNSGRALLIGEPAGVGNG
ncbi:prephenate dehydrogenase [Nocardia sp. NPDC006044]|uniref:prephenate dehydrogenase n=1 Tax=Nocardia sp. NPDC006044 TaxID=3364306 RepID=UPI0036967F8C